MSTGFGTFLRQPKAATTIYTGDGTLSGNRLILTGGYTFQIKENADNRIHFQTGFIELSSGPRNKIYMGTTGTDIGDVDINGNGVIINLDDNANRIMLTAAETYVNGSLRIRSSQLLTNQTTFTNGAGAATGTLNNAPVAGNPTKWIPIVDGGTTRYIPAW